ncbi:TPA: hypothetical protein ACH3X1_001111 [Trebouxia sp. C0004]
MASVGLLATGVTCGRPAAQLHARLVSSSAATCSYTISVAPPRHRQAALTCRAAQTGLSESPEAPEDLSDDIIDLLGPRTTPTPVLDPQEVLDALYNSIHGHAIEHYAAFYSSELQGIVTDPGLMVVHMDDHLVHRGHAVFDTAIIVDGYLYQLAEHLARFERSAVLAGLLLPCSIEQVFRIIRETAAASKAVNGHVKYWLGAGRGGFGLSGAECLGPTFYCQVYTIPVGDVDSERAVTVKTSEVPIKPSFFANVKSNNYLPNALNVMDAQADGFDQGIFVDENNMVAEGPNMNVGIITHDNELVIPPFDSSLPGITILTLLDLVPEVMGTDDLHDIDSIIQRPFSVEEAKSAREVFLTGSSLPVMPVLRWDQDMIGDGEPGRGVLSLKAMLLNHMNPANNKGQHVEVPYGYLTGMDEQT